MTIELLKCRIKKDKDSFFKMFKVVKTIAVDYIFGCWNLSRSILFAEQIIISTLNLYAHLDKGQVLRKTKEVCTSIIFKTSHITFVRIVPGIC